MTLRERFLQNNQWIELLNDWRNGEKFSAAEPYLNWMYTNLKKISKGEWNEIHEIDSFGEKDIFILFKDVVRFNLNMGLFIDWNSETFMVRNIHFFLQYIQEFQNGGLKGKAKLGVCKVGVCPYQTRKNPEGGRVFVCAQLNSKACPEHSKKWSAMLRDRRKSPSQMASDNFKKKKQITEK